MMETNGNGRPRRTGKSPGRRPLSEGDAEETRLQIRRHALRLFNAQGYGAVSMENIAESAGLTRATLYYHYRSKADIFVACMMALTNLIHTAIEETVAQTNLTVTERIRRLFYLRAEAEREARLRPDERSEFTNDHDIADGVLEEAMRHLSPAQHEKVGGAWGGMRVLTLRLIEEGIARGELRPLPVETLDFLFWQLLRASPYPEVAGRSHHEVATDLLNAFLYGVVDTESAI